MTRGTDNDLTRLLHGELPAGEARELRERMLREPGLAAAYARLERTWSGLELPPAAPIPPGFTGRVMARVRSEKSPSALSWTAAPGWVRATATAALLAGAALGIGVGRSWPAAEPPAMTAMAETATAALSTPGNEDLSLAAGYWSLVDDETGTETEARP
jgi:anti-sigma factor RsiW